MRDTVDLKLDEDVHYVHNGEKAKEISIDSKMPNAKDKATCDWGVYENRK